MKEESQFVQDVLGWFDQNEAARHLLLSVISELWVDYLTRVEALRVSIGLEAYAQRDPLVQYKGRASEMFKELLADIRMGVISRMFTFMPRQPQNANLSSEQRVEAASGDGGQALPAAAVAVAQGQPSGGGQGKKKKRKRH